MLDLNNKRKQTHKTLFSFHLLKGKWGKLQLISLMWGMVLKCQQHVHRWQHEAMVHNKWAMQTWLEGVWDLWRLLSVQQVAWWWRPCWNVITRGLMSEQITVFPYTSILTGSYSHCMLAKAELHSEKRNIKTFTLHPGYMTRRNVSIFNSLAVFYFSLISFTNCSL